MINTNIAHAAVLLCRSPGYNCTSHSGYRGQSTWGYSTHETGHNCTNYAAYRLAQNGAANPGNLGHAYNWATKARSKGFAVNGTPEVGSIAQWTTPGHVAYVEKVTPEYIETSEDSYLPAITLQKRYYRSSDREWPHNFIHIRDVTLLPRIGIVQNSIASVKEGPLNELWTIQARGVKSIRLSGNRIVVLNHNKELYAKEGPTNATWTKIADNVDKFDISGNRIGVLSGGWLAIKEGSLNENWVRVADNVTQFSLSSSRIGIIKGGVNAFVKEGSLSALWTLVYNNANSISVTDNRIAVIDTSNNLFAKEGSINNLWTLLINNTISGLF